MSSEILARWQFGITTVFHFFFVPLTISLSIIVAIFQTLWYKRKDPKFLQLTKFYGKLFLINFAMGVVTGIVQEFQFGMNWSEYSRFVGDIFGAPLALEALLAFFLESTFLGLWIFGWDRLSPKVHLATIWLASIGTVISTIFILAANSFMQNPVGASYNVETGRAELTSLLDVLLNPVFLSTFPHTIAAAWMFAGAFVAGIAGYHLGKLNREGLLEENAEQASTWRWATKFGAWVLVVAGILTAVTGDIQGKVMTDIQPMKMAAAEALYETAAQGEGASFTVAAGFNSDNEQVWSFIKIPKLLSWLATGDGNAEIKGMNDLNEIYSKEFFGDEPLGTVAQTKDLKPMVYPPITGQVKDAGQLATIYRGTENFAPDINVTFWSFRLMMGIGMIGAFIGLWMLWVLRKGGSPSGSKMWNILMVTAPVTPLLGISLGWIFAETGRWPWIVNGVLPTTYAISPTVKPGELLFSLIVYTVVYSGLTLIEVSLMWKHLRMGLPAAESVEVITDDDAPLTFAY